MFVILTIFGFCRGQFLFLQLFLDDIILLVTQRLSCGVVSDDLFCLHLDAISVQIPSQRLSDDLRRNILTNLLQCLGVLSPWFGSICFVCVQIN